MQILQQILQNTGANTSTNTEADIADANKYCSSLVLFPSWSKARMSSLRLLSTSSHKIIFLMLCAWREQQQPLLEWLCLGCFCTYQQHQLFLRGSFSVHQFGTNSPCTQIAQKWTPDTTIWILCPPNYSSCKSHFCVFDGNKCPLLFWPIQGWGVVSLMQTMSPFFQNKAIQCCYQRPFSIFF